MKKFSFRLEKLLRLRERIEDFKQVEHARAQARVFEQDSEISELDRSRQAEIERHRHALTGDVSVTQLRAHSRYTHRIRADRVAAVVTRASLERDRVEKERDLLAASRERESLEKFKEREKTRFAVQVEKEERIEADELSAQRFIFEAKRKSSIDQK